MAEQKGSPNNFSIREAIGYSWKTATKNFWFFAGILLISQVISLGFDYTSNTLQENNDTSLQLFSVLIMLVGLIVNIEISFAQLAIFLKFVDKKKAEVNDLFAYFDAKLLFRYVLAYVLLGLVTLIGFVLFIFPGFYLATKYWFVPYIYVDKRIGVIDTFKESAKLTEGIKLKLFLLGIVQILILAAGALALLVGLFIAIPMNSLSDFYIYRKLTAKK